MVEIKLNRGFVALVDDDDFERLSKFNWHVDTSTPGYIRVARNAGTPRKLVYLHREVLNPPAGKVVDHVNGNGLDNRKVNLRAAEVKENIRNRQTTKGKLTKGVHFSNERQLWVAQLMLNRKHIYIGRFGAELEALVAYDEAARKYFGEFAALNFPKNGEQAAYRGKP